MGQLLIEFLSVNPTTKKTDKKLKRIPIASECCQVSRVDWLDPLGQRLDKAFFYGYLCSSGTKRFFLWV